MSLAVRSILYNKYFVKEWLFRDEPNDMLRYICRLMPSSLDLESEHMRYYSPAEYVELPLHATIGELKVAVQRAMRDTYFTMEKIEMIEIARMEELEDDELLFGAIEPGTELSMRGYGLDLLTDLKHEGGADNWIVRFKCGAQDDDGYRGWWPVTYVRYGNTLGAVASMILKSCLNCLSVSLAALPLLPRGHGVSLTFITPVHILPGYTYPIFLELRVVVDVGSSTNLRTIFYRMYNPSNTITL
ncbi:hypothetical protein Leryth_019771 [Lithospermum erythrorhizon]|nr:hypothetical protein Leryth_019771 [Lithospermum erythrorhizon]